MANPYGPVTSGVDHHYFKRITVDATTFPGDAQVVLRFRSGFTHWNFINEGGALIEYSFNGETVHGDLATSGLTQQRSYEGLQVIKVWFRAASTSTVRVEAWASR